jgi:hypothetical protein
VLRVAPTFCAISVFEMPSAASSTILARCASPAPTEVERTSLCNVSRSPWHNNSGAAERFAITHGPTPSTAEVLQPLGTSTTGGYAVTSTGSKLPPTLPGSRWTPADVSAGKERLLRAFSSICWRCAAWMCVMTAVLRPTSLWPPWRKPTSAPDGYTENHRNTFKLMPKIQHYGRPTRRHDANHRSRYWLSCTHQRGRQSIGEGRKANDCPNDILLRQLHCSSNARVTRAAGRYLRQCRR